MQRMYHFEVGSIEVNAYVEPSVNPDTSWMDDEDQNNQNLVFFDTTVEVVRNGHVIGRDNLGESCYLTGEEDTFFSDHRNPDPMYRNCSLMRARYGSKTSICHYFPSMIAEAIADARKTLR